PCLLPVPLGNADAHGSAQTGGTAVLEQATSDDSVPDEVELRLNGNRSKAHCGTLFKIPEDCGGLGSGVNVGFEPRDPRASHTPSAWGCGSAARPSQWPE